MSVLNPLIGESVAGGLAKPKISITPYVPTHRKGGTGQRLTGDLCLGRHPEYPRGFD